MDKDLKLPLWIIAISLAVIAVVVLFGSYSMSGCSQIMAGGIKGMGMMMG